MRRVYLALYIWSQAGGIEQVVTSLACALKRQGIDVVVFAWQDLTSTEEQYRAKLRLAGIRFISSKSFLGRLARDWDYRVSVLDRFIGQFDLVLLPLHYLLARHWRGSVAAARQSVHNRVRHGLLRLLSSYDLDRYMTWRMTWSSLFQPPSVVNQQGYGSPGALDWAENRNIPTIYSEQNTPDEKNYPVYWRYIAEAIPRATRITAVSSGAAQKLACHLGIAVSKITIIPQPIEFAGSAAAGNVPTDNSRLPQGRRLLAVGRLHPMKGFDVLIAAVSELASRGQDFDLSIIGDGPQRSELLSLIQAKRLTNRVRLTGNLDHDTLPSAFGSSDIVICPSVALEGLPLAAIEAMSFGLPLVVSDVPAFHDLVVHNENGMIVPPGDVLGLANTLDYLLNHPDELRRMGRQSKIRFETGGFQADTIVRRYLTVYQGALDAAAAY